MAARFPNGATPATEALAYRMWAAAEARGWDITIPALADLLGESVARIRAVAVLKGWSHRLRVVNKHTFGGGIGWSDDVAEAVSAFQRVGAAE